MGAGDWLMATAYVSALYRRTGAPVLVVGHDNRPRWSEIFENNPKIVAGPSPKRRYVRLVNAGGARPYIQRKTTTRWIWRIGQVSRPGELYFSETELAWAAPYAGRVMIEPNVKANGHENKAWPFERWQELVDRTGLDFIQCAPAGGRILRGVEHVVTPSFRHAAAVLAVSPTFIGAEGGLMHAAAAVGVPSVILWSEFISPAVTGYPMHRNIRHAGPACGWRLPCANCAASMLAISVDEVEKHLMEILA